MTANLYRPSVHLAVRPNRFWKPVVSSVSPPTAGGCLFWARQLGQQRSVSMESLDLLFDHAFQ